MLNRIEKRSQQINCCGIILYLPDVQMSFVVLSSKGKSANQKNGAFFKYVPLISLTTNQNMRLCFPVTLPLFFFENATET